MLVCSSLFQCDTSTYVRTNQEVNQVLPNFFISSSSSGSSCMYMVTGSMSP